MLRRNFSGVVSHPQSSSVLHSFTSAAVIASACRNLSGSFTIPVWTGPLRDSTPNAAVLNRGDLKKMSPGGECGHREDKTKPYNLDPFADHYIRYSTTKKLEPTSLAEKSNLETQRKLAEASVPEYVKQTTEHPYFATGVYQPNPNIKDYHPAPPEEPRGTADELNFPEFDTLFGKFEVRPTGTGHVGVLRYQNYKRAPPVESFSSREVWGMGPQHSDHHPYYDYSAVAGHKFGYSQGVGSAMIHWDLAVSSHSLYRASLRCLPLIKNFFYLTMSLEKMAERVRSRFERNKHVRDPDAIRHLLALGWLDYTECICFRKTKAGVQKFFYDDENYEDLIKSYTEEEGRLLDDRSFWNGEEQRKNGPYDGYWSWIGRENAKEFERLGERVPMSWSAGKGYFELFKADGTNYWEKNLDYEGWFIKNMDPDRRAARREMQSWVDAGYTAPKHYSSKNRRGYRRLVKDIENIMKSTPHEMYAESRELIFQFWVREWSPESNRISAEKKLAMHDDDVFTTKFDELEKPIKQAMREMPNPRLWRTDAFYLRVRYLQGFYEYNWAKVPIGASFDKLYNDWVSNDANYTILASPQFEAIKADKDRNPMAKSWADFYREYDPDSEDSRQLPWYHPEFNYDRRYHWDERCMRMKKWVDSGDIESSKNFFETEIARFEQHVNRYDSVKYPGSVEYKYSAPRYVQLYRGLNKRLDVGIVNQMREYLQANKLISSPNASVKEVTAALEKADFSKFKFEVPTIIYPDGVEQPRLDLDGRPIRAQVSA